MSWRIRVSWPSSPGFAESRGWDGLFLWDRIAYPPSDRAVADLWVALSAIASKTDSLRIGPMITPLSRRRVQKLARATPAKPSAAASTRGSSGRLKCELGETLL